MLGAILGDIAGSRFEFSNNRTKPKELFEDNCFPTDDTWLLEQIAYVMYLYSQGEYNSDTRLKRFKDDILRRTIQEVVMHPDAGWGLRFLGWVQDVMSNNDIKTYRVYTGNSYADFSNVKDFIEYMSNDSAGNGCATRVVSVPYFSKSLEECKELTREIVSITHNHPDSYRASECLTTSMFMALNNKTRDQIKQNILSYYPEVANMTYAKLNKEYHYTELAKDTIPQAMVCFLESKDFKDALNMAISIGGDADTLGAITGALAEAFYGWKNLKEEPVSFIYNYKEYFEVKYLTSWRTILYFLSYVFEKYPKKFPSPYEWFEHEIRV